MSTLHRRSGPVRIHPDARPAAIRGIHLKQRLEAGPGLAVGGFFTVVVVIAGVAAIGLLALPGSTRWYFSWTLRQHWAAALIGGLYLASTFAFGWALTRRPAETRALSFAVVGLAAPTFVFTMKHLKVFDFSRWQAVFWVVLFGVAGPLSIALDLMRGRRAPAGAENRTSRSVRAVWVVLTVAASALAIAVWINGSNLTIRYLGCWGSFAAVLTGTAAVTGRRDDSRCATVIVRAVAVGALVGLVRGRFT